MLVGLISEEIRGNAAVLIVQVEEVIDWFLRALTIAELRVLDVGGHCGVAGLHLLSELLILPLHLLSAHHVVGLEVVGDGQLQGLDGPGGQRGEHEAAEAERNLSKRH